MPVILTCGTAPAYLADSPEWDRGEVLRYRGHTTGAAQKLADAGRRGVVIGGEVFEWVKASKRNSK